MDTVNVLKASLAYKSIKITFLHVITTIFNAFQIVTFNIINLLSVNIISKARTIQKYNTSRFLSENNQ